MRAPTLPRPAAGAAPAAYRRDARAPVDVVDAAELLLGLREHLTARELVSTVEILVHERPPTAGHHARLQGAYGRLRLLGFVP